MVTAGESFDGIVYGAHDYIDSKHPYDLSYDKNGGFGFFTQAYLDSHYGTRGR